MTPFFRKFLGMHWLLVANMFALLIFGVFCIYAASWMREDPAISGVWSKQIILIAVGTVFFFAASLINYRWIFWGGVPLYLLGIILSLMALGGDSVRSHHSWLQVGPVSIQPSQIAMAGGIIVMALVLGHLHKVHPVFRNHLLRLAIAGLVCLIPFGIVLLQNDMGSAMVWIPVAGAMLLVGNVPFRFILTVILVGLMVVPWVFFFALKPHQQERIEVFADILIGKQVDTRGAAYAQSNIIKAVGSGGWNGRGVRNEQSMTYLGFIPKTTAINDYIYTVLSEVYGFKSAILLLAGFAFLLFQSLHIALTTQDIVGRLIIVGVVALFFAHIFQHVGMNLLIMPITGIPLPFISSGGTFVVICMFLCGMIQSVWVHRSARTAESINLGGAPAN